MRPLRPLVVLAALLLAGCASGGPLVTPPVVPGAGAAFEAALHQAAVVDTTRTVTLIPASGPSAFTPVVTWVPGRFRSSFAVGQQTSIPADSWVTLVPQVQDLCRGLGAADSSAVYARLRQYLGLPPGTGPEARFFATLSVRTDALFRPCADPSVTTTSCAWSFPPNVDPAHVAWYGRQVAQAYREQGGAPWTRMGYTYDWGSPADPVGASEYVIPAGVRFEVVAVDWTDAYCAAP